MDVITRIQDAVVALRAGGLRADWGYPQGWQATPESAVVAVSVAHSDPQETALKVWVLGPAAQGGRTCEDLAQTAAQILRAQNARCTVGECHFDEETGLFMVQILAVWQESLPCSIRIGQTLLANVTDFSAVQNRQVTRVTDEETGEITLVGEMVSWTVTIRERLPVGEIAAVEAADGFTLTVTGENGVETYPQCYWQSITLEQSADGLIRQRVAKSWEERVVQ